MSAACSSTSGRSGTCSSSRKYGEKAAAAKAIGDKARLSPAACDAGLSKRQKDTALRVASVPEAEFEERVESEVVRCAAA